MTRTARTRLLLITFALLLTGVAAGAWAQLPALPAAADQAPVEVVAAPAPGLTVDGVDAEFVALLFPASDVADDDALELVYSGHRVCEAFTAGVPMVDLADSLVAEHGFTDTEARAFITLAGEFYCPAAV